MGIHTAHTKLGRYFVELAPLANGYDDLLALTERSRAACAQLTRDNVNVRLLRSIFLPEDGTCLLLFDADSAPAVEEASRMAALPVTRVSTMLARPE
jgi:hypothetical protein